MAERADLLIEIGTEELPPKALPALAAAFHDGLVGQLAAARLEHGEIERYATPRRLALKIHRLQTRQPDQQLVLRGPPARVAWVEGQWTRAAEKFAASAGVPLNALEERSEGKGAYVYATRTEHGLGTSELLPGLVEKALDRLPVPRRMRWGNGEAEFVRPVHWLVMLLGAEIVPCRLFGIEAGRVSLGHRFMPPTSVELGAATEYPSRLENEAHVLPSFEIRRERVRVQAETTAAKEGGRLVLHPALLDEVTALVEWPVPVAGEFDARFLELPEEVLIATLQDHQRCFPVRGPDGRLLPRFIAISNLESPDPGAVRRGNERVVRPRLADAAFFWEQDRRVTLESRAAALEDVVFQENLGSVGAKAGRVAELAARVAHLVKGDVAMAHRAAVLAKCDLLSAMVGEFPELQGIMGRYYALADGEPAEVATAIEEQYLPRFAGDRLPNTAGGRALALADKLDTIAGIFAIGQRPTGNRDPFGVRRAALGALRILVECELDLDLPSLVAEAVAAQPGGNARQAGEIVDFMMERLRGYYLEGMGTVIAGHDAFEAVLARHPVSPVDFQLRLIAVLEFARLDAAAALTAANKRIANILRQADTEVPREVNPALFKEDAERVLHDRVLALAEEVGPLVASRRYREALERLASLRSVVDDFFDAVLVMDPNFELQQNRLALLAKLRALFMEIADVSRLGAAAG
jgi:glycyl-tRNA synthetase beta chain